MEQLTSALPSHQHAECIEDILELLDEFYRQSSGPEAEDDLYTTIVHCDLWINNILLKYGNSLWSIIIKILRNKSFCKLF